jgi:hypothetical protein
MLYLNDGHHIGALLRHVDEVATRAVRKLDGVHNALLFCGIDDIADETEQAEKENTQKEV